MSLVQFNHKMTAHCESGTLTALLNNKGMDITEPMIFGITGAFFFAYLDTSKFTFPQFVVRSKPGDMRGYVEKRLGVKLVKKSFSDPAQAFAYTDDLLAKNIAHAVQVDMFYMDYIPKYMKAHFNGHFITVVGKDGDDYLVSDGYYPSIVKLPKQSLGIARFVKGELAPKGFTFYPESVKVSSEIDWQKEIYAGIKQVVFNMTKIPIPFLGVKGIRKFAHEVTKWHSRTRDTDHLSHEIMMIHVGLEERGTGGAGFRFMYASFLQEASKKLNNPSLSEMSKKMMENGDMWREISLFVARIGKNRDFSTEKMRELENLILARADWEDAFFKEIGKIVK